jgi:hypothetical protein
MGEYSDYIKKSAADVINKVSKDFEDKVRNISRTPGLDNIKDMPEYHNALDAIKKYSEALSKKIDSFSKR